MAGALDVIVVGAGPAGSATALLLARQGLRVLILEKSASLPAKICGEYLSPGCLPLLERLGALPALQDMGARPLLGMHIHAPSGQVLDATYTVGSDDLHGLSVRRQVLDPLLLDLARKTGAEIDFQFQVSDVLWQGNRVVGVRGRSQGHWAERRAGIVVGADGRASVIAARLGGRRFHPTLDRMAFVAYLEGVPRDDAFGEIFLGPDTYGILNPIAPGVTNLGIVADRRSVARGTDLAQSLRRTAARMPQLLARIAPARIVGRVRCLGPLAFRATRLSAPGALLVGDAAGFLDPFTGEGIYAALRCAELAAREVPLALGSGAGDPTGYTRTWRAEFHPKWRLVMALQHAIRRPWLAEALLRFLARRPDRTAVLMAAAGDLLPPHALAAVRLIVRVVRGVAHHSLDLPQ